MAVAVARIEALIPRAVYRVGVPAEVVYSAVVDRSIGTVAKETRAGKATAIRPGVTLASIAPAVSLSPKVKVILTRPEKAFLKHSA